VRTLVPQHTYPDLSGPRCLQIALAFMVFLQLAAFFTILAVGMWIDSVSSGAINSLAQQIHAYQATFVVLAVVSTPAPEPATSVRLTRVFQVITPWMISVRSSSSSSYVC